MAIKYKNFPFEQIRKSMDEKRAEGWTVFQKFTCAGCGQRLTMGTPNEIFDTGTCDQCDVITDIRKDGCNYMATTIPSEILEAFTKPKH
jgi:hypothetical protein